MRKAAIAFGLVFLIPGILGFTGVAKPDEHGMPMLLNLFVVGTVHNIVHIATGVLGLLAASISVQYARLFLQVAGIAYALIGVIGLLQGDTILGLFAINMPDNFVHLVPAAAMLALGFGWKPTDKKTTK